MLRGGFAVIAIDNVVAFTNQGPFRCDIPSRIAVEDMFFPVRRGNNWRRRLRRVGISAEYEAALLLAEEIIDLPTEGAYRVKREGKVLRLEKV